MGGDPCPHQVLTPDPGGVQNFGGTPKILGWTPKKSWGVPKSSGGSSKLDPPRIGVPHKFLGSPPGVPKPGGVDFCHGGPLF